MGEYLEALTHVQEIILICFLALVLYFFMVLRILMRKGPVLVEGFTFDCLEESFTQRSPESIETAYSNETDINYIYEQVSNSYGRLKIDNGFLTFVSKQGKEFFVDRSCYVVFEPNERFNLTNKSEDVLYHIDMFKDKKDLIDQNTKKNQ